MRKSFALIAAAAALPLMQGTVLAAGNPFNKNFAVNAAFAWTHSPDTEHEPGELPERVSPQSKKAFNIEFDDKSTEKIARRLLDRFPSGSISQAFGLSMLSCKINRAAHT